MNYLLPKTKQVLLEVSEFGWLQQFTFVGGSGLSLYLHHRLSEDIDLFTWEKQLVEDDNISYLQPNYKVTKAAIAKHFQKEIDEWLFGN